MVSPRWLALVVVIACADTPVAKTAAVTAPALVDASASTSAVPSRPHHKGIAFTPPEPVLGITTPMRGEADPKSARLVPTTCDDIATNEIDATVTQMRADVNASFMEWARGQPACWEQMREEWRQRQAMMQHGGATLWGVGEGGGGYGEGIGLGSIGTIGHGSGVASRFSGTNNQVAGVDEADLVKTDGRYVYLVTNGALRIIEAMKPRVVSVLTLPGTVRELFVSGDRAVVFASNGGTPLPPCTYGYDCALRGDGTKTSISVVDVTDRAAPKVVRTLDLSGSLVAARRIGNTVHTVVADNDSARPEYETWPEGLPMCGTPQATVNAKFAMLRAKNERLIRSSHPALPTITENGKSTHMCRSVLQTSARDGNAFTSVVSFDLGNDKIAATTASMRSRPGVVFASSTGLYVSVTKPRSSSGDESSEIHEFRIGDAPDKTRYVGSGHVPGHVLNQFAMDEWYGYLRVATSIGHVPDPRVSSVVSIMSESPTGGLVRVGALENLAPAEDIRAVRFDGERAYVVTFKKTDPLFVIDTLQPQSPKLLGELKIPGFSTYIHRIDGEHLLSIGFDANDHGSFAYFDGIILQMFDVKNPTEPKLLHKEKIGTRGSSSEAATNHLAFNYFASQGLLAIPMTTCEGGGDGSFGSKLDFSGLLVYDVGIESGFTRLGGVNHGGQGVSCSTWWSNATSQVKRSVFLDDLVYSIAENRVKVQNIDHLGVDIADFPM